MQSRFGRAAVLALYAAMTATAAAAQEAPPNDPFAEIDTLTSALLDAEVVAPGTLAVGISSQTLTATNSGNTVTGETIENGDIVISPDAFSGFSGIGNFVMNTGNNNNLQGSIGVVVIITPPPTSPP
jgi:hypothetical protein